MDVVLRRDARSVQVARRLVCDALGDTALTSDRLDDVALLVSELVTNALVHSDGVIRLLCETEDGCVRVSVHDGDRSEVTLEPTTLDSPRGRGLLLVDLLASRWGVRSTRDGKAVWFEIDR